MSRRIERVLVANRGEIAVRIFRSLAEQGIESIAVYSDADADAVHRNVADRSIGLGGSTAAESYLQIEKIIAAANEANACAIHPGYGFLSENAAFSRAVEDAGLVFIGPSGDAMERLGSKQAARIVADRAGVPTVPGCEDQGDDAALLAKAREIGFPVLVKASAGGGGKGMRLVDAEADFLAALKAGRREAQAAFGDSTMLCEKRVFPARHVEIQVLADAHGNAVSLHERECSVQRRHQKVLEEAPSPCVSPELRERMGEASVRLVREAGYRNAGTVEYLVDEDGSFYFLEVNTRLQVEHPVTELVTGLDLVALQVRIAEGASLDELLAGRDLTPRGHALEARIYAEVPEQGFLPAAGRLQHVVEPVGPGVRVDSGVATGSEVSVHFDPMLAKLIVHAPSREAACRRMAHALRESVYLGISTNVDFLCRVVEDPDFVAGRLRTDFLDLKPELASGPTDPPPELAYVAAAIARMVDAVGGGATSTGGGPVARPSAFQSIGGLRVWGGES
ncbi:MAG: ATP-grasp domain-containing protein [Planctomycetes bacterium]|nr:ATP-grasp domain-containing protein [Planctomycetota bacterium]